MVSTRCASTGSSSRSSERAPPTRSGASYKGVTISLVQLRLERGSGDENHAVFDGLLVELVLPRHLSGTTAVVADQGALGNLKQRFRAGALRHIDIDDSAFVQRFQVYGTHPVEAHALVNRRFRERLLALGSRSRFELPGAIAEGNRFVVALPKRQGVTLFEPPGYWSDAGGQTLADLSDDIEAVLGMADSVIGLHA